MSHVMSMKAGYSDITEEFQPMVIDVKDIFQSRFLKMRIIIITSMDVKLSRLGR